MYTQVLPGKIKKVQLGQFKKINRTLYNFISKYTVPESDTTRILETSTKFNVESISRPIKCFVNLRKINIIKSLNSFFSAVNSKLPLGGVFIGCVEIYNERIQRIHKIYPKYIANIVQDVDFVLNRVFPKIFLTRNIYKFFFSGINNALSKAETFGRLYYNGFEIIDYKEINNLLYFISKKITEPLVEKEPTYGLIYKTDRVGKNGKTVKVYKLRTMNPYAEFLQNYIYIRHNLKLGGKFKDDFRITSWGKMLRKYWIDELPMIINLLKGDIKLVGVRPLSRQYFDLYLDELKEKRMNNKPGLIPPYYADLPKSLEEIMESEKKYFQAFEKNPLKTDFHYLTKSIFNIVFKQARSS